MAWTKLPWSDVIGSHASPQAILASGMVSGDYDSKSRYSSIKMSVRAEVAFDPSSTDNTVIRVYGLDKWIDA